MSQSSTVESVVEFEEPGTEVLTVIEDPAQVQEILEALGDPGCRSILQATTHQGLTATEIAERCEIPLSTTYRKLELLTEISLLTERTRIQPKRKHASEYELEIAQVGLLIPATGRPTVELIE